MIGYDERRKLLLAQHENLRKLIAQMRAAAGSVLAADEIGSLRGLGRLRRAHRPGIVALDAVQLM